MPKGKRTHTINGRKERAQTLDNILNPYSRNPYHTDSLDEYQKDLNAMNMLDLQKHCIQVGVKPKASRQTLITKLCAEFKRYYATDAHVKKTLDVKNSRNKRYQKIEPKNPKLRQFLRGQ